MTEEQGEIWPQRGTFKLTRGDDVVLELTGILMDYTFRLLEDGKGALAWTLLDVPSSHVDEIRSLLDEEGVVQSFIPDESEENPEKNVEE